MMGMWICVSTLACFGNRDRDLNKVATAKRSAQTFAVASNNREAVPFIRRGMATPPAPRCEARVILINVRFFSV